MQNAALAFFIFAAIAVLSAIATPARAEIEYPWCAVYSMIGGGTNCGFSTLEQCRATISGIGGSCEPNQFYKGPTNNDSNPKPRKKTSLALTRFNNTLRQTEKIAAPTTLIGSAPRCHMPEHHDAKHNSNHEHKPVKLTVELPPQVNRDLIAYAEVLGQETGQTIEPAKLVAPMLARFMSTDRAFARSRRDKRNTTRPNSTPMVPPTTVP